MSLCQYLCGFIGHPPKKESRAGLLNCSTGTRGGLRLQSLPVALAGLEVRDLVTLLAILGSTSQKRSQSQGRPVCRTHSQRFAM